MRENIDGQMPVGVWVAESATTYTLHPQTTQSSTILNFSLCIYMRNKSRIFNLEYSDGVV